MKRFLLFAGKVHYPDGGWLDFEESFDSLEDARAGVPSMYVDEWWHIVDSLTGEMIYRSSLPGDSA